MSEHSNIAWPVKAREIHNHHMNSAVWNDFKFRDDDIVIATYGKSGTTWLTLSRTSWAATSPLLSSEN